MPLFEYRCRECGRKFAQLVGMTADSSEPKCPKCGSTNVSKLISRFSRMRGDDERMDTLENAALGADFDDPSAMRRRLREMGREMGEDLGEDLDEFVDEAERDACDDSDEDF